MPTYGYTCRDCGHSFDIVQKMTEDTLTICPRCGGRLRKVFAAPAIAFKGSGFYATDHGKGSKGRDETKDATAGTKADTKKDGGSSESSPGKKTDDASTKKESSGTAPGPKEGSDP
ncbi:MAG: FmdB family transcriptional regulator [Actinobacteria bacterium]|nr:MAG: FmdB family transcriptional regulator [Actinomycetota bacterium]